MMDTWGEEEEGAPQNNLMQKSREDIAQGAELQLELHWKNLLKTDRDGETLLLPYAPWVFSK